MPKLLKQQLPSAMRGVRITRVLAGLVLKHHLRAFGARFGDVSSVPDRKGMLAVRFLLQFVDQRDRVVSIYSCERERHLQRHRRPIAPIPANAGEALSRG